MQIRAAFYVDGFNAYHSIHDLQKPHLKWLNWRALGEHLIPSRSEVLVKTAVCTAVKTSDPGKQERHRKYLAALATEGVDCLRGHFTREERKCTSCGQSWWAPVEKQGDVNLAIAAIAGAYDDIFDHCYLVTADSDQAATAKLLKARFPNKKLTTVVVTGRSHSKEILGYADAKLTISEAALERCMFPGLIHGAQAVVRPKEYKPPWES